MAVTMKQNITLSLDKELIRQAKILAAQKSTSISALLAEELTRLVQKDDAYQQAMEKAFASMEKGYRFGGKYPSREELYDRQNFR